MCESVFSDFGGEGDDVKGNLDLTVQVPEMAEIFIKADVGLKKGVLPLLGSQNSAWERLEVGGALNEVKCHVSGGVICVGPALVQLRSEWSVSSCTSIPSSATPITNLILLLCPSVK